MSMAFMQTMFEVYLKGKKAGKSKKRMKRDFDSKSISDNEWETGCVDMFLV
jgi:hypothetical protein